MTTTITIEVDKRTKSGKAFLAMVDTILKNQTGIRVVETGVSEQLGEIAPEMDRLVKELSKKTNKALTKRLFAEHGITYP